MRSFVQAGSTVGFASLHGGSVCSEALITAAPVVVAADSVNLRGSVALDAPSLGPLANGGPVGDSKTVSRSESLCGVHVQGTGDFFLCPRLSRPGAGLSTAGLRVPLGAYRAPTPVVGVSPVAVRYHGGVSLSPVVPPLPPCPVLPDSCFGAISTPTTALDVCVPCTMVHTLDTTADAVVRYSVPKEQRPGESQAPRHDKEG